MRAATFPTTSAASSPPNAAGFTSSASPPAPTCPPLYAALVGVKAQLGGLRDRDTVVTPALAERISNELANRNSS